MPQHYRWDDFHVDLDAYTVERGGLPLTLEPKAFNLLVLLIQRPGHLFTKQEIFDAVWPGTAVSDHALTRVVAQVRRVLGDEARDARYLETVPTRGYRWIRPVEAVAPSTPQIAVETVLAPGAIGPVSERPSRRWMLGAAVALGIVALVWFGARRNSQGAALSDTPGVPPGRPAWPVQLTTHRGMELNPSPSPAGDAIAFSSDRTGDIEIYVRTLGATPDEIALTRDGGHNVHAAWSPDGRMIAYHSAKRGGVWVVSARGGAPRQVSPFGAHPAWSRDGRRIAFQSDEQSDISPAGYLAPAGCVLWIIDLDGTHLGKLTEPGHPSGGHTAPSWSPDGRFIAFSVFEGGIDTGLWVLDVQTGRTRPVARRIVAYESVFSASGAELYAAGGEPLIWRVPFDPSPTASEGKAEAIGVPGVPGVRSLALSADGRQLLFAGLGLDSQIWAQKIRSDGSAIGEAFALTSDTNRRNSLPVVSPDGATVAYVATRRGEAPNIWLVGVDGSGSLQLTADPTPEYTPMWTADGRVTFLSNRPSGDGLWSLDIATRREQLIFDLKGVPRSPTVDDAFGSVAEVQVAPSGHQAVLSSFVSPVANRRLFLWNLDRPTLQPLTDRRISVGYPAWSPDERQLGVEIRANGSTQAAVIDVGSGAMKRLTEEKGETWIRSWSPDGQRVAAATLRQGRWGLQAFDVATAGHSPMAAEAPANVYLRSPSWSPRGDVVVFERGEIRGNIWQYRLP